MTPRVATNLQELNRVLGGGVVPGSMVLIGGDPGIGKSTLLLQVSGQLAHEGRVLYVTGKNLPRKSSYEPTVWAWAMMNFTSIQKRI